MRVVTWNMGHAFFKGDSQEAWEYLETVLRPDVALLQEALHPRRLPIGQFLWKQVGTNNKHGHRLNLRWGAGIYTRGTEVEPIGFDNQHEGWLTAVRAPFGPDGVTVIDLHAEIDAYGGAITSLHRIFSDLTPVLERSKRVIIGGDFNADRLYDRVYGLRTHGILFDRVEAFGLWHCNRLIPEGKRKTITIQHRRAQQPWQDDHLFVSEDLQDTVRECFVADDSDVRSLSDHHPVVMELDL